jgi:hypothetical protein
MIATVFKRLEFSTKISTKTALTSSTEPSKSLHSMTSGNTLRSGRMEPSKLVMRVRFPSPAPTTKPQVGSGFPTWGFAVQVFEIGCRAISVPLATRGQSSGRFVAVVVLSRLVVDVRVNRVRDRLVGPARLVLVDHRGPRRVMPHAGHKVAQSGPAVGRELIAGVPQIVEMQSRHPERLDDVRPAGELAEVVSPDRPAFDAREDERRRFALDVHRQVLRFNPLRDVRQLS